MIKPSPCGSCPYRIGSRQSECKCRDFWVWFFESWREIRRAAGAKVGKLQDTELELLLLQVPIRTPVDKSIAFRNEEKTKLCQLTGRDESQCHPEV